MKNLKHFDLEYLEQLPSDTLSLKITKKDEIWKQRWKYRSRKINGVSVYKILDRIIDKNIGKSFDETFSYFCKLVPIYCQKEFLDLFNNKRGEDSEYFVDEKGLIQVNKNHWWYKRKHKKRKLAKIEHNAKYEQVHKVTGHKFSDFHEVWEMKEFTHTYKGFGRSSYSRVYKDKVKFLYYEYRGSSYSLKPKWMRYIAQESDFITILVEGYVETFDSRKHPKFVRHFAEIKKSLRKIKRETRKEIKEKVLSFISKKEEELKREKEKNLENIQRHGFDPVTSFRK